MNAGKEAGVQGARFTSTLLEKAAPAQDSPKEISPGHSLEGLMLKLKLQ